MMQGKRDQLYPFIPCAKHKKGIQVFPYKIEVSQVLPSSSVSVPANKPLPLVVLEHGAIVDVCVDVEAEEREVAEKGNADFSTGPINHLLLSGD